MAKLDPNVLVLDVESTCWEPPETQPANEISEVIEIGLAVVNTKELKIVENESIIIRPQKSKVSKFCTKLTTLTQEYVDQGTTFQSAMEILRKNYKANDRVFISWGDYDRKMFERNCRDYDVKYPFGPRHLNLRNTFALFHALPAEAGMDGALELLGMKLDGTHHRGVDDARNIANLLIHTLKKFRATDLNLAMEEELDWRHKQDAASLEHSKELESQKIELLKRFEINNKPHFFFGQRVIVDNEIGIVHTGKTLRNKQGHDVQSIQDPQTPGYVWVYLPSRGYASHYSADNIKPLPNNQL